MPEPFAAFMQRALFDPQRGYYTRHIRTVGARGDFSTSATLAPQLGGTIADWLKAEYRLQPRVRHIIEVGAGDGSLMQQVRKTLGLRYRWRFTFHIVETSPVLRLQQQHRFGSKIRWHDDLEAALTAAKGEAFIFHNELLDAFPAVLVEWRNGQWLEVWVPEQLQPLTLDPAPFSALLHHSFQNGQRCEIHASVRTWLQNWLPHWKSGSMLTIDYGDEFPHLYHRHPKGTLRGYFMHQRLYWPDLLSNPGRQDITADINFTDYRAWLSQLGCEEASYQTLAEFMPAKGTLLSDPDGAGSAFKCLVHRPA
ncbi:MAG: SAM-dependent methyltransferase [Prosthecobacter sp.]|uniref:SAM-dependent methyltransferase n=1 Tax=Prosthecobacter sp. TaxID=1965333 RepID=UPI0039010445